MGDLGEAIAGQINEIPGFIDEKVVDRLGFTGASAHVGQLLLAGKHVDQRGLADIGTADKGVFRHLGFWTICIANKAADVVGAGNFHDFCGIFASMSEAVTKKVVPFRESKLSKKEQIAKMFDQIAFRYDFLNHFMSLGIDKIWRRKALQNLTALAPQTVLDVAAGTADFSILAHRMLGPRRITGVDISKEMLEIGRRKVARAGLRDHIVLQVADSEALPFESESYDAVTAAFGVRNFEQLEVGLKEMGRVLRKGGMAVILEFSSPTVFPVKQLYHFYFRYITPRLGKWIAKDEAAYAYLPESVRVFPQGEQMTRILKNAGFQTATCKTLTFGICSVYCATK